MHRKTALIIALISFFSATNFPMLPRSTNFTFCSVANWTSSNVTSKGSTPSTGRIAAVGGANQHAAVAACAASTAVMQIHGDADPCWHYLGGAISCLDANPGAKASVSDTMKGWAGRNGCRGTPLVEKIPDTIRDGTSTTEHRYQGCSNPVVLLLIENGGHTWPRGYQYFRERRIGKMSLDFSASEVIVRFFEVQRVR